MSKIATLIPFLTILLEQQVLCSFLTGIKDLVLRSQFQHTNDFLLQTSGFGNEVRLLKTCGYEQEQDGNCAVASVEEARYVWTLEGVIDPFMFLQMDFQRPHLINRIKQLTLDSGDGITEVYQHLFEVSFSKDGVSWSVPERLGCDFVPSVGGDQYKARYLRIFASMEPELTSKWTPLAVMFVPFGHYVDDYTAFSNSFAPVPCTGHQASLDLQLVSGSLNSAVCSENGMKIEVEIQSGTQREPLYDNLSPSNFDLQHVIFSSIQYLDQFDSCEVSFTAESLQYEYSGIYIVKVHDPQSGLVYIDDQYDLQLLDDGEPLFTFNLPNGQVDYFSVNVDSFKYFAFILPFSIITSKPVFQQQQEVREGCRETRRADVVTDEYLEMFQAGGTNNFAQSVILNFAGAPRRQSATISDTRILYFLDGDPGCLFVDNDGRLVNSQCNLGEQVSGIMCFMYEGEINSIEVEHTGCSIPANDDQTAYLEFSVTVDVVGCLLSRFVTCESYDTANQVIRDSIEEISFGCIKNGEHNKMYQPKVILEAQIVKVRCYALRRINSESTIKISDEIEIDRFQEDLRLIVTDELDVGDDNHIYMKQSDYGSSFAFAFETIGYPVHTFRFSFLELFGDPDASFFSPRGIQTSRHFVCGQLGSPRNVNVKAIGTKRFNYLEPRNTGLYTVQLNHDMESNPLLQGRDIYANCTLVHPYSIECAPTCNLSVPISHNFHMQCVINHHVFTQRNEFKKDYVPVSMKFMKYEKSADIGSSMLSQCEYNTLVESSLYHDYSFDSITWNTIERSIVIDFQIYTVQLWNSGRYYLEIIPGDSYCIFQSKDPTKCAEMNTNAECATHTTNNRLDFRVEVAEDPGWAHTFENGPCGPNTRAVYLDDPRATQFGYYYKACYQTVDDFYSSGIHPSDFCLADGGQLTDRRDVFLSGAFDSQFLTGFHPGYDDSDIMKTIACNSYLMSPESEDRKFSHDFYFLMGDSDSKTDYSFYYFESKSGEISANGPEEMEALAVLCRYRRGFAWLLRQKYTECEYEFLNIDVGLKQHVQPIAHGNVDLSILCVAHPDGSSANQTLEGVSPLDGFNYTVDFRKDFNIESFSCSQNLPEELHDVTSKQFDFTFTSLHMHLETEEKMTYNNLYCNLHNSAVYQPCYNQNVSIGCCAKGNPIQNCTWVRRFTDFGEFPEGQDGIRIEWSRLEDPQCNNPGICSTIHFEPLQFEHNGIYSLICYNGLENIKGIQSPLRSESEGLTVFGFQTLPVDKRDFTYQMRCDWMPPKLYGYLVLFGPPIEVDITCDLGNGQEAVDSTVTYPSAGVVMVEINLIGVDRQTPCFYSSTNEYATDRPLKFPLKISEIRTATDVSISSQGSYRNPELCCSMCAFDIDHPKQVKLFCKLENGFTVPFANNSVEFNFDPVTSVARKCGVVEARPKGTFECSCYPLFDQNMGKVMKFFANGDVSVATVAPTEAYEIPTQPAYNASTAEVIAGKSSTSLDEKILTTTPERQKIVKLSYNDYKVYEAIKELTEQVDQGNPVVYTDLIGKLVTLMDHMKDELTTERLSIHVPLFQAFDGMKLQYNTEHVLTFLEQHEEILTIVVPKTLDYVEKLVQMCPLVRENENDLLPFLESVQGLIHNIAQWGGNESSSREYTSGNMKFVMQNIQGNSNDTADLECRRLDFNGVTSGTLQEVKIKKDTLDTLPAGTSVVLGMYESDFGAPRLALEKEYQPEIVNMGKEYSPVFKSRNRFQKRMTDVVSVTVRDPDGVSISVPVQFSLNYVEAYHGQGEDMSNYEVDMEYVCAYYVWENDTYEREGMRGVEMGESRGVCSSTHTTSFAVVAVVDQAKTDDMQREDFFWVSMIGMTIGSVAVVATFLLLLFVHDVIDEEEHSHHMLLLFFYNLFLCSYLSGADKIVSSDHVQCRLASMMMLFSYLASQGSLLNISLNLLNEYEPRLWERADSFPIAYIFNTIALPGSVVAVYFGMFREDIGLSGDGYACFPSSYRPLSFLSLLIAPTLLYVGVTLLLYWQTMRSATELFAELRESGVWRVFQLNIQNNFLATIIVTVVLFVSGWMMSVGNWWVHLLHLLLTLSGSVSLCLVILFYQPEIRAAFNKKLAPKPYELRTRKRIKKYQKFEDQSGERSATSPPSNPEASWGDVSRPETLMDCSDFKVRGHSGKTNYSVNTSDGEETDSLGCVSDTDLFGKDLDNKWKSQPRDPNGKDPSSHAVPPLSSTSSATEGPRNTVLLPNSTKPLIIQK